MHHSRLLVAFLVSTVCLALAPSAAAQKLNSKYRKFPDIGLEFKSFKDMSDVPINDRMKSISVIGQGSAEDGPRIKLPDNSRVTYNPNLFVFYDEPQGPLTGNGSEESDSKYKARTPADYIDAVHTGISLKKVEPEVEDFKSTKKIEGSLARFDTKKRTNLGQVSIFVDVYTFYDGQSKLVFVWDYPNADKKHVKKWGGTIKKSMKSLRYIKKPGEEVDLVDVNSESSYEDLIAWHENDVNQTPGWELVETPNKQYLIKTNCTDKKDVRQAIKRLEASRRLFEEDFPPAAPITSISVVRVCATLEEFSTYGQTRPGVAGYFNPGSEELVLFFGDGKIEETLGVMTHEAFHQYCHFLFNRSAAHRWFDEGHGDYYGAWIMKGKNLKPGKDMEGRLSRVPHLKDLHKNNQLAPLSDHIRFDHPTWQSQGPLGISNYCQSFSLIYFLREGARRKVKRKYWSKEYADIIPNYMRVLNEGFRSAYEKIAEEAREALDELEKKIESGAEIDVDILERYRHAVTSPWDGFRMQPDFQAKQQTIWDDAMEASWGKIDEREFEEKWLDYIDNEI